MEMLFVKRYGKLRKPVGISEEHTFFEENNFYLYINEPVGKCFT